MDEVLEKFLLYLRNHWPYLFLVREDREVIIREFLMRENYGYNSKHWGGWEI